ncbi:DUF6502 family protein [Variovorax sp. PBL-E5]|uniref:DUF6502 family protein n=1 Tax=Variovorax sp. PBL-E5 TaxID=434014 RepID=UPI001318D4B0|nr:DUF6502 family protein [Variovorax sp. PBL-E5]VTU25128.1 hypothetical protein E5CHR_01933 [Variovorax sp. PBL-E5]
MDNRLAWAQAACARVMRPLVRLGLALGLKHRHLEELMRDLLLDEARRVWRTQGVSEPNISQLSVTTGLNRKAITAKVRETADALPSMDVSAAAKTFTMWLQVLADDPASRRLPITGEAQAQSFEKLARQGSRGNVHHRAILDELVRLNMVSEDGGYVELKADGFVPAQDLQSMLAFMGDNSRDHLLAAVSNILGERSPMLERSVYANGLSLQDCENIHELVRRRWNALHLELTREMTRVVDGAGDAGSGRIRVGIYTYYEDAEKPSGSGGSES